MIPPREALFLSRDQDDLARFPHARTTNLFRNYEPGLRWFCPHEGEAPSVLQFVLRASLRVARNHAQRESIAYLTLPISCSEKRVLMVIFNSHGCLADFNHICVGDPTGEVLFEIPVGRAKI
jgi:hypothetical protein